ncbi:thiolase family protein [Leptospira meyeri]|uniref:thiolase family protein n=1 Tax=Leptospira meyeri TaxID=29508 RepID=UPI000C29EB75|nr:thiolase family protein [Leptospira meyeri]PJZ79899.1 beta-ketoadipyl CoA thiolase [Leptospira meyeri]PJZ96143.1 beta-ketoadipyl CoA thiolase [Leptospira meyeri]PKA14035.1 beta-ketoadipyl CoA thiolase [Leptospira meyeri]PKA25122.1 beta-ketoadipyl CoA thiolase [Leptospira sp. mixed culture ATI2-C-A1]
MVVLLDGVRTPFGKFGGGLKDYSSSELGVISAKETIRKTGLEPEEIEESIYGNVIQDDKDSAYLARHIGLRSGLKENSSALTVNRLCGSGMESVIIGARKILSFENELLLVGGTESMSNAPYIVKNVRWGNKYGDTVLEDRLAQSLTDCFVDLTMGQTAENIAKQFHISRLDQDDWASNSQVRAEKATESGIFSEEMVPIFSKGKNPSIIQKDEQIRGVSCVDQLKKLPTAFLKEGSVTAGNSSGINDGAASLLIASEKWTQNKKLKPLSKILGYANVGCDPKMMGLGPVFAIPKALQNAGIQMDEVDLFEINEAYAAQTLAVMRELKLSPEKTNVNGGAIAIGHPLGASGTRVILTLAYELRRKNLRYGVASLCIGGGQGIAIVLENSDF